MKKIILLALVFLVACMGPQQPRQLDLPDVYVGTEGLEMSIAPGTSKEVSMGNNATIIIELANKGAYRIENGQFSLILEDHYMQLFEGLRKRGSFTLGGRTKFNPDGDITRLTFRATTKELPKQIKGYGSPFIFQLCYPYVAYASAQVCVDPDIENKNPNKPCEVTDVALSGGQGAPVAITKIEQHIKDPHTPVEFDIYLKNHGEGYVISPNAVDVACGAETSFFPKEGFNVVQASGKIQEVPLKCSSALLDEGESKLTCIAERVFDPSQGTFSSILSLRLEYGYVNTLTGSIKIRRPNV